MNMEGQLRWIIIQGSYYLPSCIRILIHNSSWEFTSSLLNFLAPAITTRKFTSFLIFLYGNHIALERKTLFTKGFLTNTTITDFHFSWWVEGIWLTWEKFVSEFCFVLPSLPTNQILEFQSSANTYSRTTLGGHIHGLHHRPTSLSREFCHTGVVDRLSKFAQSSRLPGNF